MYKTNLAFALEPQVQQKTANAVINSQGNRAVLHGDELLRVLGIAPQRRRRQRVSFADNHSDIFNRFRIS